MARRNLLHRDKLIEFECYLKVKGHTLLEPKGDYELLRWKGEKGKPMPIVFDRNKGDHLSLNDSAEKYVREFLGWQASGSDLDFEFMEDIYGDLPDGAFFAIAEENGLLP